MDATPGVARGGLKEKNEMFEGMTEAAGD